MFPNTPPEPPVAQLKAVPSRTYRRYVRAEPTPTWPQPPLPARALPRGSLGGQLHPAIVSGQRGEARGRLGGEEEEGERRGRGLQPVLAGPARRGQCRRRGRSPMRSLRSCRRRGAIVGTVTLCLAAGWALQTPGGVSLIVPQPNINATVAQNILLSVEYSCRGIATVEWKHVSSWGTTKIVEWKSGNYINISSAYKDRVTTFENGSIQLLNVGMRDAGYYFITVTEEYGTNTYGTIILNVYEIIYEDLHFVVVLFVFLAAVSAILICFMWLCNKSLYLFQKKTHKLTASTTEEIELETIEC